MTLQEMSYVMDLLYSNRASALPASALAEVFGRLIWCLKDQSIVPQVLEAWLTTEEKGKVEIALTMNETYPFKDVKKMESVLFQISSRWPDLADRCHELVNERRIRVND